MCHSLCEFICEFSVVSRRPWFSGVLPPLWYLHSFHHSPPPQSSLSPEPRDLKKTSLLELRVPKFLILLPGCGSLYLFLSTVDGRFSGDGWERSFSMKTLGDVLLPSLSRTIVFGFPEIPGLLSSWSPSNSHWMGHHGSKNLKSVLSSFCCTVCLRKQNSLGFLVFCHLGNFG